MAESSSASPAESTADKGGDRLFWLVAVAMALLTIAAVWIVPYIPTNDGPQALFSAHVVAHHADPDSILAKQFDVRLPLVNHGFDAIYQPLASLFGWRDALRAFQTLLTLGWGVSVYAIATSLHRQRRFVGLLGLAFAFTWPFYMGFFSFTFASMVGVAIIAMTLRRGETTARRLFITFALFLQFVMHPFAAAFTGLGVAVVALSDPQGGRKRELIWLAATGAPLLLAASSLLRQAGTDLAQMPAAQTTAWEPIGRWLQKLPRVLVPGPTWRAALGIAVAGTALATTAWRRDRSARETAVLRLAILWLVLGCVLPRDLRGWQLFGPRLLPLGLACALPLLAPERLAPDREKLTNALIVGLCTLSLAVTLLTHRQMYDDCAPELSGLNEPLKRDGVQLPIVIEATCDGDRDAHRGFVPFSKPLLHAGALYAIAHGGTVPYAFSGTSIHKIFFRPDFRIPTPPPALWAMSGDPDFHADDRLHRAALTEQAIYGMSYESIVALGASERDKELLRARGYDAGLDRPGLFIGVFEPCRLEIAFPEGRPEAVELSYGPWGLRTIATQRLAAERPAVQLSTFCGSLWVRIRALEEGRFCRGAREDGKMRVEATREPTRLVCEL